MATIHAKRLSLVVLFTALTVRGQNDSSCLSLQGSTACPAFAHYYVGLDALQRFNLVNSTGLPAISALDEALQQYVHSQNDYAVILGCNGSSTPPYARYALSRICTALIQETTTSLPCNYNHSQQPMPLCSDTCSAWVQSVANITIDTTVCPNQQNRNQSLATLAATCSSWDGYDGTAPNCISGSVNEPSNCGFDDNTSGACTYCGQNGSDPCCKSVSCHSSLSTAAIVGITVGCVMAVVLVGLAMYFFCCKTKKRIRQENGFSFATYTAASMGGDKVLLQNDLPEHRASDPFDDHHEIISLAPSIPHQQQHQQQQQQQQQHHTIGATVPAAAHNQSHNPLQADDDQNDENNDDVAFEEEFYQVIHPYPPQVDDELGLEAGDIVCLALQFDDGWGLGFNVTSGQKGVFPVVCVSRIPPRVLEQLLGADPQDAASFSSKVLVEDEPWQQHQQQLQQHQYQQQQDQLQQQQQQPHPPPPAHITTTTTNTPTRPLATASLRKIRDDLRRSASISSASIRSSTFSSPRHPLARTVTNASTAIPKRTASIRRNDLEPPSPTSPTLNTPLVSQ